MRDLNLNRAIGIIADFIGRKVHESRSTGIIIGISGGVDSATTAALAVHALGAGRVQGLLLPYFANADVADARLVCEHLGISYRVHTIAPVVDTFLETLNALSPGKITRGNLMARTRMQYLYAYANEQRLLVLGTGNRSEWLTGYFTKWGDGATDIAPIVGLYKTEVWEVARRLGLPHRIVEKPPSAGLWIGQTDEEELGITYRQLDPILYHLADLHQGIHETASALQVPESLVLHVDTLIRQTYHKRSLPEGPELY